MASLSPSDRPYDWADEQPRIEYAPAGEGLVAAAAVALAFAVAAIVLGVLVVYATVVSLGA